MNKFIQLAAALLSTLVLSAEASVQGEVRLRGHEQGTLWAVEKLYRPLWKAVQEANRREYWYRRHTTNEKTRIRRTASYEKSLCVLNKWAQYYIELRAKSSYSVVKPEIFNSWGISGQSFYAIGEHLGYLRNCNTIDALDGFSLHQKAKEFYNAYRSLRKEVKYGGRFGPSNALTVALKGIPLRVEILNGSVKFKATGELGPFEFFLLPGISKNRYRGAKILIFRSPNRKVFYYHMAGKTLEVRVPSSKIKFDGETVTITCDYQCGRSVYYSTP